MLYRRSLPRTWVWVGVTTAALLGALAIYLVSPINGDIRYEAGVKQAGTSSAAGTFSHRPLAFRMLMDGVFRLAHALSVGTASFELAVRLLAAAMAIGSGVLLWRGLLKYRVRQPGLHAIVVVGAILLISPINAGEPDWMATVLATAGTGLALMGRRRPWLWALLAAAFFVGAAGMKVITLPTALLGLGVVALLDRRQLLRVLIGTLVVGFLYVLITVVWVPWEVQWLLDIRTVQKDAWAALPDAIPFLADSAARRPAFALVPAMLVLAGRRERLLTVLALALSVATVVAQGQYFGYHSVPMVVVASVAVFRGLRYRMSTTVGVGVMAVVLAAAALTTANSVWLANHQRLSGGATIAVGVAALIWAFAVRGRRPVGGPASPLLAALATLALLLPSSTPWAAQLLRPESPNGHRPLSVLEARTKRLDTARQVRQVVGGPDVPVTYLTFGDWTYFIGNPTTCRYPSPLFLQRTAQTRRQVGTPSYQENLDCLSASGSRWLIWDPSWFSLKRTPASVQAIIAHEWDCSAPKEVRELRLCPRRR